MTPRIIVLTGATRGLGRTLAEALAAMGHVVLGCGQSSEQASRVAEAVGPAGDCRPVDVTDPPAVERWAASVHDAHGAADLLINNAGRINRNGPLWELAPEERDPVVDTNIKGVMNVIRAFVPAMVSRRRGVIVNLSSGWGRSAAADVGPYCATKWAIEGLTRSLAKELPDGMAAVPVNPGVVDTDMLRSCFGAAASGSPAPEAWADRAAPFVLGLGPSDNGRPRDVSA